MTDLAAIACSVAQVPGIHPVGNTGQTPRAIAASALAAASGAEAVARAAGAGRGPPQILRAMEYLRVALWLRSAVPALAAECVPVVAAAAEGEQQ